MNYIFQSRIWVLLLLSVGFLACEPDLDSEDVTAGVIRFPSIILNGDNPIAYVAGEASAITDPGVTALLGTDDITSQVEVTGVDGVDFDTPGIYPINYSVSTVNDLGDETTVTETRYVLIASEDISGIDLTGDYFSISRSFSGASYGQLMSVRKLGTGYFDCTDVYAHPAAENAGRFFVTSATEGILLPQSASETIFGLEMFGTVDIQIGNTNPDDYNLSFNLDLPAASFQTTKPWTKNENVN